MRRILEISQLTHDKHSVHQFQHSVKFRKSKNKNKINKNEFYNEIGLVQNDNFLLEIFCQ